MELLGKFVSNNISKIRMLPRASKYVSIKFSEKCLHILNNKYRLNLIKGSTKVKNLESLIEYQSCLYNIQSKNEVNHRGMKLRWNKKLFP